MKANFNLSQEDEKQLAQFNHIPSMGKSWAIFRAVGVGVDGSDEWRIEAIDGDPKFSGDAEAIHYVYVHHYPAFEWVLRNTSQQERMVMIRAVAIGAFEDGWNQRDRLGVEMFKYQSKDNLYNWKPAKKYVVTGKFVTIKTYEVEAHSEEEAIALAGIGKAVLTDESSTHYSSEANPS